MDKKEFWQRFVSCQKELLALKQEAEGIKFGEEERNSLPIKQLDAVVTASLCNSIGEAEWWSCQFDKGDNPADPAKEAERLQAHLDYKKTTPEGVLERNASNWHIDGFFAAYINFGEYSRLIISKKVLELTRAPGVRVQSMGVNGITVYRVEDGEDIVLEALKELRSTDPPAYLVEVIVNS